MTKYGRLTDTAQIVYGGVAWLIAFALFLKISGVAFI